MLSNSSKHVRVVTIGLTMLYLLGASPLLVVALRGDVASIAFAVLAAIVLAVALLVLGIRVVRRQDR